MPQHSGLFPGGGRSTRLPNAGCPGIIPLAIVAAPLHTPSGHHYLAKLQLALHCSAAFSLNLFAASESWHRQCSRLARLSSVQPVTGPARYVTSLSESPPRRDWAGGLSHPTLGRGPTSGRSGCGLQRTLTGVAGSRQTWVGSAAFSRKLLKWGKKSWRGFPPARKHARVRVIIVSLLFSGCNVNRQRAGRVRAQVVTAVCIRAVPTQRLHLCLEYGPGTTRSTPAHTYGNSGRGRPCGCGEAARWRNGYQLLPEPGGCRTRPDSGVAPDRRPGPCDVSPACCVARDHRPAPESGREPVPAYGLYLCPWLGGCRIRLQPGCGPESWALATGPGGALLARRLVPGR